MAVPYEYILGEEAYETMRPSVVPFRGDSASSEDSNEGSTLVAEYDINEFRPNKSKSRSKKRSSKTTDDPDNDSQMNGEVHDQFDENYIYDAVNGKPPKAPGDRRGKGDRRTGSRDSTSSRLSTDSGTSDQWDHGPHRPPSATRTPKKPLVRRRSSLPTSSRKGRKVRFTHDTKPSSAGSREKPPHYHVMVLCSPDKQFEMRNLAENLDETGYDTKVLTVNEDVFSCRADVIIAAVSLRFTKATDMANHLYKTGRPILPICLDTITFPPANLNNLPRRLNPIDCTLMENRAEWQQSKELTDVIDRLETLIPAVRPIRGIKRERSSSNIPLARGHHKSKGHPPLDPLAREASEITIRVKPPTPPRWDKKSHIPIKAQDDESDSRSESEDSEEENRRDKRGRDRGSRAPIDEDLDPGIQDQGDGESLPDSDSADEDDPFGDTGSLDSEVRTAKQLQNDYRLPPVTTSPSQNSSSHRRSGSDSYRDSSNKSSSNGYRRSNSGGDKDRDYRSSRDRDYRDRDRSSPPDAGRDSDSKRSRESNKKISNWDGPKLPSVYRKRVAQTIY